MAPLTSLFELDIDDFSSPDDLYVRSYVGKTLLASMWLGQDQAQPSRFGRRNAQVNSSYVTSIGF